MAETRSIVYLVVGILWILLEAGVAAAAFYRFRATPAGIVLGGAFALMAVKGVATQFLTRVLFKGPGFQEADVRHGPTRHRLAVVPPAGGRRRRRRPDPPQPPPVVPSS